MRTFSKHASRGFSLIEMLVVIGIVLLLSGLTLGGLRASRTYQVLDLAASRFEMLLELAQTVALSEGKPAYLVIADHQSQPAGVPMRAYTFIRDLDHPELMNPWQFLPNEVVFAEDRAAPMLDLVQAEPLAVLEDAFAGQDQGSQVAGQVRVLLELSPDGTLRTGPARALQPSSLLLERGEWFADAALNWYYKAQEDVPLDAVRILFRPRSGTIRSEEVLP